MKKQIILLIFVLAFTFHFASAKTDTINIIQLIWGPDYQLYIKYTNDSLLSYNFDELIYANPDEAFDRNTRVIFYPVAFDPIYLDSLMASREKSDYTTSPSSVNKRKATLWNAISDEIGGGWVHFINCILFALETRTLELDAPLLMRPKSSWKPKPITESWKRTHKWKYYIPVEHRYAKKEFFIRKKKAQLRDIESLPAEYVKLFLKTTDRKYKKLLKTKEYKTLAKVDIVKLLLATPYLGEAQIDYIKSRVLLSISNLRAKQRPSILIFDKYQAAVILSLDGTGYKIQKIVFRDQYSMNAQEIIQRSNIIRGIIELINIANNENFKKSLYEQYK